MPDAAAGDAIVELVIQGLTLDGKAFRPSDWAERLCGVMSAFGGYHRMQYSPYVHPVTTDGVRCVVVDVRLVELDLLGGFAVREAEKEDVARREFVGADELERGAGAEVGVDGVDEDACLLAAGDLGDVDVRMVEEKAEDFAAAVARAADD